MHNKEGRAESKAALSKGAESMTAIESESYQRHDVPADSIQKWQKTVDLMAAIFDVPAGLIIAPKFRPDACAS